MKRRKSEGKCPACGGQLRRGATNYISDYGEGILIVKKVPAILCSQCGEELFELDIARKLEKLVQNARDNNKELEVMTLG